MTLPNPLVGSYVGVESFRRANRLQGSDSDAVILEHLNAASRDIERLTLRFYYPYLTTAYLRWPQLSPQSTWMLWSPDDLLSVTTLQAAASGNGAVPVSIMHFYTEPNDVGPPYSRVETDLSYSDVFQSGPTPQRSISLNGMFGYCNTTAPAGSLAVAINAAVTAATCSDASRIDQGDVLLIDSEAIYVDDLRARVDTTATLTGNPAADVSVKTIGVSDGTQLHVGEVILVDAESMLVQAITANNLTVTRAWDGSALAAHTTATHVYAARGLTIQRGVNGTTAASHLLSAPISRYRAPDNIRRVVRADAIGTFSQDMASWGRLIGQGDMQVEFQGKMAKSYRQSVVEEFRRVRFAAV